MYLWIARDLSYELQQLFRGLWPTEAEARGNALETRTLTSTAAAALRSFSPSL